MAKNLKNKMSDKESKVLNKNLQFESLLGEISSEFINVPLESIDAAIESSMKKLVDFFKVDRCHLGKLSSDQSIISIPFFYSRPNLNIPQITEVGEQYLSFVYESIKQDKLISFSKSSELPSNAKKDREVIDKMGIKSLLILPIKIDSVVQYGFSFFTVTKNYNWEKQTINRIIIAANILANVIQRKIALKQIIEEKEWSEAIMEGMPQLTYVMNLEGRLIRWNKNYQDLVGYSAEELKDKYPRDFLSEEHNKKVTEELQKIIEDGKESSVEYDIITKGGKIVPDYYGSGKLVKIGDESFFVGQTIDISEMKQAQRKITSQLEEISALKEVFELNNSYFT